MHEGKKADACLPEKDMVLGMLDTPCGAGEISQEAGDETGHEGVVFDPAQGQYFQGEDGAGDGCTKDSAETGGDTRGQKHTGVFSCQPEFFGKPLGQTAADLHRRTLTASGTAKKMGHYGGEQDHGRHSDGDSAAGGMDLVHDEVVAGLGVLAHEAVEHVNEDAGNRKQKK